MTEPAVSHLLYLGCKHVMLTSEDACQVNHSHFKSFVNQFQRDSKQQLHHQVAYNVLYTGEPDVEKKQNISNT